MFQIDMLRKELDSTELAKKVEQYESKLQLAVDENDRLQKTIKDLEKWKVKLEKESEFYVQLSLSLSFISSRPSLIGAIKSGGGS